MALNSFQLFLGQIQSAPEVLKIRVLQIVFDILMVHEGEFLAKDGAGVRPSPSCSSLVWLWEIQGERIIEFLLHILDNEESDKVQALLCMGLAKLMLVGMASEDRVMHLLLSGCLELWFFFWCCRCLRASSYNICLQTQQTIKSWGNVCRTSSPFIATRRQWTNEECKKYVSALVTFNRILIVLSVVCSDVQATISCLQGNGRWPGYDHPRAGWEYLCWLDRSSKGCVSISFVSSLTSPIYLLMRQWHPRSTCWRYDPFWLGQRDAEGLV